MSQSPLSVTYSLEEILKQINNKLDTLQNDVTDIKIAQAKMEAELKGEIKALKGDINVLDEKVNGLSKRLENQEFVNRGILIALVVAILGGAAKLFGWVGNP